MEDRFSQPQEGPALHTGTLKKIGPVLRPRHGFHDGVGDTLGLDHEPNQALVGTQVEGGLLDAPASPNRHELIHQQDAGAQLVHQGHQWLELVQVVLHGGDIDVEQDARLSQGADAFEGGFEGSWLPAHIVMGCCIKAVQTHRGDDEPIPTQPAGDLVIYQGGVGGHSIGEAQRLRVGQELKQVWAD